MLLINNHEISLIIEYWLILSVCRKSLNTAKEIRKWMPSIQNEIQWNLNQVCFQCFIDCSSWWFYVYRFQVIVIIQNSRSMNSKKKLKGYVLQLDCMDWWCIAGKDLQSVFEKSNGIGSESSVGSRYEECWSSIFIH